MSDGRRKFAICAALLHKRSGMEINMEDILEQFGTGILSGIAGSILFLVFTGWLKNGGMLYECVLQFMQSICG